jgi:HK97 family phage prohead protease
MAQRFERRAFKIDELRVAPQGEARTIVGHAAVFNLDSEEMYGMIERVAPGAFAESIDADDIRALWNHDSNFVLGRNLAKTLRLKEDKVGLAVEIDVPDTQWARDLCVSIDRGDVSQMSFGFRTLTDSWRVETVDGEERVYRTLEKVKLFDVSPVTYPAYPDTDVGLRELDAADLETLVAEGKQRIAEARGTPGTAVPLLMRRRRLDLAGLE